MKEYVHSVKGWLLIDCIAILFGEWVKLRKVLFAPQRVVVGEHDVYCKSLRGKQHVNVTKQWNEPCEMATYKSKWSMISLSFWFKLNYHCQTILEYFQFIIYLICRLL